MKMKLAILLACSALAGFVIAASKPSSKDPVVVAAAAAQSTPKPAAAKPLEASTLRVPEELAPQPSAVPDASSRLAEPKAAAAAISAAPVSTERRAPSTIISSEIGGRDLQFLSAALEHGRVQLYLGELAKNKADTEQIKAVGEVISDAQMEENKKLVRLATMKGVTLPSVEPIGKKAVEAKLGKLTGPKFDKTLMEEIINVNQQALAIYEAAANTKDGDIKAFIDEGLRLAKEKLLLANKMSGNARRSDKTPGFRSQANAPRTQ
jgi:putative membrane protein